MILYGSHQCLCHHASIPDLVRRYQLPPPPFPLVPPAVGKMPTSSFHPPPDSLSLGKSSQVNSGSSPGPRPQSAWKSVFRFPNSSSRKLPSNGTSSETRLLSHSPVCFNVVPVAPNPSLTPVSDLSDQRSSYNSSNTQSSDSNGVVSLGGRYVTHRKDTYPLYSSTDISSRSRQHTNSERTRPNTTMPRSKQQAGNTSQLSCPATTTTPNFPRSRTNGPLSPKSMGATASRFIRRVASAPNAKGLFSIGSKPSPATKNGFLAPADTIPTLLPPISSSMEQGTDSLETMSSGSSRGQISRAIHPSTAPYGKLTNCLPLPPVPGKTAFRRTYSSNSIKVRQVGHHMIGQLPSSYIIHQG
jgi:protein-serine/threonine kinase